ESSCLKCHHQVTDLVREGVRQEAPKLLKGYNLVREIGCFGCHEISGLKSGRRVGPDLRLEPDPPLESLSPAERVKAQSDPLNPPGTMRKVGPSLFRLAEKTTESWVRPWIKEPRGFRPDTKMPHFYQQVNNLPENLPENQKKFPDTEIASIAHYLIAKSQQNLNELKKWHSETAGASQKDAEQLATLAASVAKSEQRLQELQAKKAKIDSEMKELAALPGDVDKVKKDIAALQLTINRRKEMLAQAQPVALSTLPSKPADEKRGRMLFGERGCLACHVHQGTEKPGQPVDGKKVPEMMGEAAFAPNLTRVAAKLMPEGRSPEDARKWLVQWLLNPSHHNPRTLMPNVQLQPEEANDIAAWLLSQKVADWTPVPVAEPDTETLVRMAKMHLEKVVPRSRAEQILKNGLTDKDALDMKLIPEADERELMVPESELGKPLSNDRLMMYVGKKAISYQGCFGCHSIPGFQSAKLIGTPLNDWGKKDVERLAFEDSDKFVKAHFNIVKLRDDPKDPSKPADEWKKSADGKKPYEQYFADMLDHHHQKREGFLHLKLMEPRSYDYERIKNWDERLRMPQFSFARSRPKAGETPEEFERRASFEEAEAREAVMTFILGLVAEPVPSRYVYQPTLDRLNEVKGQQVIDKFNCAGCHVIRPGAVDFKPFDFKTLDDNPEVFKSPSEYKGDDVGDSRMGLIRNHLSWAGLPQPRPDRQTVRGVPPVIDYKQLDDDPDSIDRTKTQVWLMDAFQYGSNGSKRDVQASGTISIPNENVLHYSPEAGGRFMSLLSKYLQKKDAAVYGPGKVNYSAGAGPPTLIHEGERVQPDWLYRFLLNPVKIRELTVLRMPKFNMSEEEAMALVNYFTSVDKTHNFGIGLTYPYVAVPQREPDYAQRATAEYIARLKATPVPKDVKETGNVNLNPDGKFKNSYEQRLASFQKYFDTAFQKELEGIKEKKKRADDQLQKAEKEKNQADIDLAKKAKEDAEKEEKEWNTSGMAKLKDRWEHEEAYLADAQRLVVNGNLCLTCHKVGGVEPKEFKGPTLDGFSERGRPDWTQRWVTNPKRFLHYESIMPINFKASARENQDAFIGNSEDQIRAVADFLMLYQQIKDWPVLKGRDPLGFGPAAATPIPAAEGKK
ncbi:MAG TPA: c-type cytochrome, partial [Gemmataceae bacterium]|nr:c-type cytochrome [Gemmataceae bacterium]